MPLFRENAPFWVVDVVALIGIICFVMSGQLAVNYGIGAMFVIIGFGTGTRAQLAARKPGAAPVEGASPALPVPVNGGLMAIALSVYHLARF